MFLVVGCTLGLDFVMGCVSGELVALLVGVKGVGVAFGSTVALVGTVVTVAVTVIVMMAVIVIVAVAVCVVIVIVIVIVVVVVVGGCVGGRVGGRVGGHSSVEVAGGRSDQPLRHRVNGVGRYVCWWCLRGELRLKMVRLYLLVMDCRAHQPESKCCNWTLF